MVGMSKSPFQSTLPRGERLTAEHSLAAAQAFQSTLPRGERPTYVTKADYDPDFNPRSREGSDVVFRPLLLTE